MSLSALAYKKLEVIQNVVSYHVALERETKLVENVLISNTEISPKPSNRGFESFWTCKLSGTLLCMTASQYCIAVLPRMRLHASDYCDYSNLFNWILLKPHIILSGAENQSNLRYYIDVGTLVLSTTGSAAQTCEDLCPTTNSPNLLVWRTPQGPREQQLLIQVEL